MITIDYVENLDDDFYQIIYKEFNRYAMQNEISCDYKTFAFIAKCEDKFAGIITGNSCYKEVHVSVLIVLEQFRNQHIGSELLKKVENYFEDKGFESINLSTYGFQAPEFYKKYGYKIEFVRTNKENPKLNKYFFVKYF